MYLSSVIKAILGVTFSVIIALILVEQFYVDQLDKSERQLTGGINKVVAEQLFEQGNDTEQVLAYWTQTFGYQLSLIPIADTELNDEQLQTLLSQKYLSVIDTYFQYDDVTVYYYHSHCACTLKLAKRIGEEWAQVNLVFFALMFAGIAMLVIYSVSAQRRQANRLAKAYSQYSEGDLSARAQGKFPQPYKKLATTFNRLADQIQSLMQRQQQLIQAVAHELRTPLARIRFALDMSRSAPDIQSLHEMVKDIDQDLDELDELVKELLYFVGLNSKTITKQAVLLRSTLQASINKHQPLYQDVQFELDCAAGLELTTDEKLLGRMIDNLVSNAAKYGNGQVLVSAALVQNQLQITVEDNGNGIASDKIDTIFTPFVRLDESRTSTGFGLGLAIVAAIAEQLDIKLTLDKSELGGAAFGLLSGRVNH